MGFADERHAGFRAPGNLQRSNSASKIFHASTALSSSQSVSFHGPTPRSPHRLSIRLRRSRSTTSTEYSLPGATQLSQVGSQVRSVSPSEQGDPCRFLPCTARAGLC